MGIGTQGRAALLLKPQSELIVEDVYRIEPGTRDVVVRIEASGVCHSDLSLTERPAMSLLPMVLGHEGAGIVEWTGTEVSRVRPGQRVILSITPTCGTCWHCARGEENLCELGISLHTIPRARRIDGSTARALMGLGTFSDAAIVHEASCVPIETDLPPEQLALIGCGITTGVGAALNTASVQPGDSVVVIGAGGVGTAIVQGSRIAGAARLIVVDPVAMKRTQAIALGATDAIDPADGDPVEQVRVLTDGRGADHVFEAVGAGTLVEQALEMTRRRGTTILVGLPLTDDVTITPSVARMIREERTIKGSFFGSARPQRDFERIVDLAERGRLDLASMISKRLPLESVNEAFAAMRDGSSVRTVLV